MTKDLGRLDQLRTARNGLLVWKKCLDVAMETLEAEIHEIETSINDNRVH